MTNPSTPCSLSRHSEKEVVLSSCCRPCGATARIRYQIVVVLCCFCLVLCCFDLVGFVFLFLSNLGGPVGILLAVSTCYCGPAPAHGASWYRFSAGVKAWTVKGYRAQGLA